MFNKKTAALILIAGLFIITTGFSQTLSEDWKDYLHYTTIGRFDLAKGCARRVLDSQPDPVELLNLSKENPKGYEFLLKIKEVAPDKELAGLTGQLLDIIEQGNFVRRSDPGIIIEEVKRLSSTERGWLIAVKRLQDAGEYAIPFMLNALADPSRGAEFENIARALPQIGRDSIRPLAASLQANNINVKSQTITALGEIKYPQSLAYLKYVYEKDSSPEMRELAGKSIMRIDPAALRVPAAQLFYQLAESYYYHAQSLSPAEDAPTANIWLWDSQQRRLNSNLVAKEYFYELMAMQTCEWALKADPSFGPAIGLWIASFFKAESADDGKLYEYLGDGHLDAHEYATMAGVEYLHQALARAIRDKNAYVALGVIEALSTTAGEKSLLYRFGMEQPLIQALSFGDKKVRYSAAISIAAAGPKEPFVESKLVVANLAEAIAQAPQAAAEDTEGWNEETANDYALRAATVMHELALTRNPVIDLSLAQNVLVGATRDDRPQIQILVGETLAYLKSPVAQRAIAEMALNTDNNPEDPNGPNVRVSAFYSLATSAKLNANLLDDTIIDSIYELIKSEQGDSELRTAASTAYGALNLPSQKVKDLILDQSKS
ncbi:MAG: HEAT repeat domain-containing protein [Sedimentisphaerales bacterium]|nr:HEAT repeat domain-containing protein [Sedimentisphaerales bacterium]